MGVGASGRGAREMMGPKYSQPEAFEREGKGWTHSAEPRPIHGRHRGFQLRERKAFATVGTVGNRIQACEGVSSALEITGRGAGGRVKDEMEEYSDVSRQ